MIRQTSIALLAALSLAGCVTTSPESDAGSATANPVLQTPPSPIRPANGLILTADGRTLGSVSIGASGGVEVVVNVTGMTPGTYGIHLHAVGRCEAPLFTSAGPHWNPTGRQHGRLNPMGAHHGDLPNLVVPQGGSASLRFVASGVLQGDGGLMDSDGAALVIHARPDDELTDPTGNSGDRIACAVLTQG